jgi:DNA-directed RNA polymerase
MTMDREVAAEKRMRRLGRERAERNIQRAATTGNYSTVGGGHRLLAEVVLPLAEGITEYLAEVQGGGASTRTQAAPLLCQVEAAVAAYLTASSVINAFAAQAKLAGVALTIGSRMEDEVRFGALKASAPALYATLQASFTASHSQSEHYRKRVLAHYAKANRLEWDEWTPSQQSHLGLKLIDLMIATTGMVEIEVQWVHKGKAKPRSVAYLVPTQAALDVIHEVNAQLATRPHWMPTVVPPKAWTTPTRGSGGYHFLNYPLVQSRNRAFQEELAAAEMPGVLRAVNAMQETAWSVNCDVLATVLDIWESSHDVEFVDASSGKVYAPLRPRAVLEELPPINKELLDDELRAHKRVRKAIHERNLERTRNAVAAAVVVSTAVEYASFDSFFFPQFLDFRGRCYPRPTHLTPQGDDLSKSLLTFADAVPLGESGVEWLAIHGANSWGHDKVSLEERIAWISDREVWIRTIASDPMEHRGWMAADAPFAFLAFCFEWDRACASGDMESYASSLPVGVDGSCNGLQHFSAMLRDPVGGAAVNLVPDTTPHDVYGEVLAAVKSSLLVTIAGSDQDTVRKAQAWLDSGLLVRDLVKRPTMTLPYGCTKKGVEAMLMDDVVRPAIAAGSVAFPEDASGWRHVNFMAGVVWDAMGEVVIAARAAMAWLQAAADSAAGHGAMVWHTPLGFPVRHLVLHEKVVVVKTMVGGKRLEIKLREDSEKVDKGGMRRGVAPNFVHALDATHLYMTVCGALDAGITSFAMVHDSYGTQAGRVAELSRILRANFVRLYSDANPMEDLAAAMAARGIEVPALPPRGELDLSGVERSLFFFA